MCTITAFAFHLVHSQQTLLPWWWFYLEGITCSTGISIGSLECSPRFLHLAISKFQYLPILLRSLKFVFISLGPQGLFLPKPSEVFSWACASGSHPKNWSQFCFGKYSGLFFCRSLLFSICPQMPWRLLFSVCVLVCVLFPCTIVLKNVMKEKAEWMWITCCMSLLSRN